MVAAVFLFPLSAEVSCNPCSISTLVVMPNPNFPYAAQAGIRGYMKDVEGVARESSLAVEMAVATSALASIQTDANMSCGA